MTTSVDVIHDVAYIPNGSAMQTLDIYLPPHASKPYSVLFAIHGGGSIKADLAKLGQRFAKKGYAVLSVETRTLPDFGYPATIQDTFCALGWTYANAETYGFDVKRIFALGHSSGGTFVSMLGVIKDPMLYLESCPACTAALQPPRVRAVIAFTGVFDYERAANSDPGFREYIEFYLGATQDEEPERWIEASAITHINGSEPPFLLIHGEEDVNIPPIHSQAFATALVQAGTHVKLVLVPEASHMSIISSEACYQTVDDFLRGFE